jgi:hypothetical protein
VPYERVTSGPDGKPCTTTGYRAAPIGADPAPYSIADRDFGNILASYPECPPDPARPAADPQSPQTYAVSFWEEIPLPAPKPQISPGRAITGKLAYLETRGKLRDVYSSATPVGALTIDAVGTYEVDWGDGTKTGPYTVEGTAWPDGQITHQYIDVGSYDVLVTERWTATWRLGSGSGRLYELRTTGGIDGFPVEQIQAVIYR